jgi:hypothetical protein
MSTSNWTTIKGNFQGDISYSLRKVLVTPVYIDLELTIFGERWEEVDIGFEYRLNNKEEWKSDAIIVQSTSKYLRGNKLFGLSVSKYGEIHTIQWKYSENNLFFSNTPQIKLNVLPRIRVFSSSGVYNQVSSVYGDGLTDLKGQTRHRAIGVNESGQYMCLGQDVFYIIDSLEDEEYSTSSDSSST